MCPSFNGPPCGDDLASIHTRYEQFQRHDEDKAKFVAELIAYSEQLVQKCRNVTAERDEYRAWFEKWQLDKDHYELLLRNAQQIMSDNPFIMVLIDGDGMIDQFRDDFIRDAEAGGRRAASFLHEAINDYIANDCKDIKPPVRIYCRVYANVKGLAEVLVRAGVIQSTKQFEDFVRAFTQSRPDFDFVDVGAGKDRADEKIIDAFKGFAPIFQCRRILFGCSHDNGYARTLEKCSDRTEMVNKVVLLEGVPFEKELLPLPYKTKKFPKLFRDKKLSVIPWGAAPVAATVGTTVFGTPSLTAPVFVPGSTFDPKADSKASSNGLAVTGLPPRFPAPGPAAVQQPPSTLMDSPLPSRAQLNTLPRTPSCSTITSEEFPAIKPSMTTWASKAAAPPPPQAAPVQPVYKVADRDELIARNRAGQRVDPPCKDYDKAEVDRIKRMKLCNVHFLREECPYDNKCTHLHGYHLTSDEKATLRLVARMAPCIYGSGCEDNKCIYGHRCPAPPSKTHYVKGTKSCIFGDLCKFPPELHDIDTTVVKTLVIRR
ncbi:hypothetical protein TUN199_08273 [Pyrenophora tritici-repentis]|nr:hypothetical protein PtrV1_08057 [Pyrenophora tritici-repentis]KAI0577919.1 hypothetical protein Alg130_08166 [Pyrenophora tritici-repentis]KAI0607546.1 hypothetical protein TUN205_08214 [Pyrenophora tritici-repentis]KAI0619730.1 hypothetical protein TUN199_08273 [Pyrenophora tritici-repentis]